MKKLIAIVLAVVMLASVSGIAVAGNGNSLPSGPHYNLNIIAKKFPHPEDGSGGNVIFVDLGEPKVNNNGITKTSKIYLEEAATADEFYVVDNNATEGHGDALFRLPNPACADTEDPAYGETKYQVFVRIQGKPNGSFKMYTCGENETEGEWCSDEYGQFIELTRPKGNSGPDKKAKNNFQNVSTELLTVYVDVTDDGVYNPVRYYLFDPMFENYLWKVDNNGAKLVQLRFYLISTCPEDL
jgi:hypothetical protein